MSRVVRALVAALVLAVVIALGGGAGYLWFLQRIESPGPLAQPATVIIPKGDGAEAVAFALAEAGVIENHWLLLFAGKMNGDLAALKAGEYAFPAGASVLDVLALLRQGRTVVHRVTVPEGLTSQQVVRLVVADEVLLGDIEVTPPEGALLPETYHFNRGETRPALIRRMRDSMDKALAQAWAGRAEGLPYENPEQALTMASIIEKETAVPAERPRVAGVFINRLRKGMRLQSDPTVVYALTDGSGELGRALTRADWRYESSYNTYYADGLPPGPIANPGLASINAALHPEEHEFLYFVADGSGGHTFSKTLADHNRAVKRRAEAR